MSTWIAPTSKPTTDIPFDEKLDLVEGSIINFWADNGYGPTIRELCSDVPSSTSSMHRIVKILKHQKRIDYAEGKSRTIRVVS